MWNAIVHMTYAMAGFLWDWFTGELDIYVPPEDVQ